MQDKYILLFGCAAIALGFILLITRCRSGQKKRKEVRPEIEDCLEALSRGGWMTEQEVINRIERERSIRVDRDGLRKVLNSLQNDDFISVSTDGVEGSEDTVDECDPNVEYAITKDGREALLGFNQWTRA